jgi:hypothetical protein
LLGLRPTDCQRAKLWLLSLHVAGPILKPISLVRPPTLTQGQTAPACLIDRNFINQFLRFINLKEWRARILRFDPSTKLSCDLAKLGYQRVGTLPPEAQPIHHSQLHDTARAQITTSFFSPCSSNPDLASLRQIS